MTFLAGVTLGIVVALVALYAISVWLEWEIDDRDDVR
jgi:hypothetical protein